MVSEAARELMREIVGVAIIVVIVSGGVVVVAFVIRRPSLSNLSGEGSMPARDFRRIIRGSRVLWAVRRACAAVGSWGLALAE